MPCGFSDSRRAGHRCERCRKGHLKVIEDTEFDVRNLGLTYHSAMAIYRVIHVRKEGWIANHPRGPSKDTHLCQLQDPGHPSRRQVSILMIGNTRGHSLMQPHRQNRP